MKFLWHPDLKTSENTYVLFMGKLKLEEKKEVEFKVIAKDNYRFYINREEKVFGPARFAPLYPEYTSITQELGQGEHEIACVVHQYGIDTRFSDKNVPCFFWCEVQDGNVSFEIDFKVAKLEYFINLNKRNNPLLGWMEFIDTRQLWDEKDNVKKLIFKDCVEIDYKYNQIRQQKIHDINDLPVEGKKIDEGVFIDRYGRDNNSPSLKFMLRDLKTKYQPMGVWKRFDLGYIGLYRPEITVKAPAGSIMEAGYSSFLFQDRVNPVIALTGDASHNLDRFILSEGQQTIKTFNYRGLRFIEIHVYGNPEEIEIHSAVGNQRTYYPEINGNFSSNDERLNDIWHMSAKTVQSCSEDALTDTPVRERGQWTGDMMASGIENIAVLFGEMSLPVRSIIQAYEMRNPEGLVPAQYPGHIEIIPMYSLMWITGSFRYFEITGDEETIRYIYPGILQTIDAFMKRLSDKGVHKIKGTMDFIDWGYHHIFKGLEDTDNEINITLNIYLIGTLEQVIKYDKIFADEETEKIHEDQLARLKSIMVNHFYNENGLLKKYTYTDTEPEVAGFNSNVTALYLGLIAENNKKNVIDYIKNFILNSYPANPDATMMDDPNTSYDDTITPYFAHYTMAALIENGEIDFVLQQYKTFWGWMLDQGMTTAAEVFDIRWSHCHAWSACPVWQLSRYVLGIWPDSGKIIFKPYTCNIEKASGFFPDTAIKVEYERKNDMYIYKLTSENEIELDIKLPLNREIKEIIEKNDKKEIIIYLEN